MNEKRKKVVKCCQKCPVLTCGQVAGTGHYIEDKGLLTHFWSKYENRLDLKSPFTL